MLQQSYLIALDIFRECRYDDDSSRLAGWLALLCTEDVEDAVRVVERFPWIEEIYREIAELRGKPSEVIGMYSSMIMELDNNSIQFIVDEQKAEIESLKKSGAEKDEKLAEKDEKLAEKDEKLAEQGKELAQQSRMLKEAEDRNCELMEQIARLKGEK
jgi:septal ring factor EnvC (AmiA/AmiB activator)